MNTRICVPALLLAACTFDRPTDVEFGDSTITIESGEGQAGIAGAPLAMPFAVTVTGPDLRPIENFTVRFEVMEGGGVMEPPTIRTDILGNAEATLTLGTLVGTNTVVVSGEGISGEPIRFVASGLVGPAAHIVAVAGDGESVVVGAAAATPLVARLEDANTNPIAGAVIDFSLIGVGTLSTTTGTTAADGATETTLTLGTVAGASMVTARFADISTTFSVTAAADVPATIQDVSGNAQTGVALVPLAPFVARVRDQFGNAVPGAAIDFVRTAGTGTLSPASALTDANGLAQTVVASSRLGDSIRVEARTSGLAAAAFTATLRGFAPRGDFAFAVTPRALAVADFNGDGRPDLAVTLSELFTIQGIAIRLNTTPSNALVPSFGAPVGFPTNNPPRAIGVGDLNGDGRADLVIGTPAGAEVLTNTTPVGSTTLTFTGPAGLNFFPSVSHVAISDFDGDGRNDIVLATGSTLFHLRNSNAGFVTATQFETFNANITALATVNFDGNGRLELIVAAGTASLMPNVSTAGAISFNSPVVMAPAATDVAMVDLDGDTKRDVAVCTAAGIAVVRNTSANLSTPTFDAPLALVGGCGGGVTSGDFNADAKPDLVFDSGVLLNTTTANTLSFGTQSAGFGSSPVVADFNGDGKADVAAFAGAAFVFLEQ